MPAVDKSVAPDSLATRLKTETAAAHEAMHVLMGQLAPFADRDRYARFVAAQYVFQCRVDALCANDWIASLVPDLGRRGRAHAARADLLDLGADVPSGDDVTDPGWGEPIAGGKAASGASGTSAQPGTQVPSSHALQRWALGWLYVSEGSTLGAAFLFKQAQTDLDLSAQFGARNLAAAPEGRAQAWRGFVAAIDAAALSATHQKDVVAGAQDAFSFFAATLTRAFEGAAALKTQTL